MAWMSANSIRRNFGKYILALVALSAAVAVSSLGMSGVTLMSKIVRQPVTQLIGGDLLVMDKSVSLYSDDAGSLLFSGHLSPFDDNSARVLIGSCHAGSLTTTLLTVCHSTKIVVADSFPCLAGRLDLTGNEFYSPPALKGHSVVAETTPKMEVFAPVSTKNVPWGSVGDRFKIVVARVKEKGGSEAFTVDLAQGAVSEMVIAGTYSGDMTARWLYAPLSTVQAMSGVGDRVSWIGVCLEDLMHEAKARDALVAFLAARRPSLQVIDAETVGEIVIKDFSRLRKTASLYFPVTVLMSAFVITVTCLSLLASRRHEIALMRAIGQSRRQVAVQFVAETCIVGLLGGVLGNLLARLFASALFRASGSVTALPAVAAVVIATLVSTLTTRLRAFSDIAGILRNP